MRAWLYSLLRCRHRARTAAIDFDGRGIRGLYYGPPVQCERWLHLGSEHQ